MSLKNQFVQEKLTEKWEHIKTRQNTQNLKSEIKSQKWNFCIFFLRNNIGLDWIECMWIFLDVDLDFLLNLITKFFTCCWQKLKLTYINDKLYDKKKK